MQGVNIKLNQNEELSFFQLYSHIALTYTPLVGSRVRPDTAAPSWVVEGQKRTMGTTPQENASLVRRFLTDVVADERVAVRATVTGTHRESLVDLAPNGASFEITYVWFGRIEDGRIAEMWSLPDGLGLLQQLDAIPEVP